MEETNAWTNVLAALAVSDWTGGNTSRRIGTDRTATNDDSDKWLSMTTSRSEADSKS